MKLLVAVLPGAVFLAAALSLIASVGCRIEPHRVSVRELSGPEELRAQASSFWENHETPRSAAARPLIAIVEFSIDYVGEGGDPAVRLSEDLRLQLPGLLHRVFIDLVPEFGRRLVPADHVSNSFGYGKLSGVELTAFEFAAAKTDVNLGTRDSGWYPVRGLKALNDRPGARRKYIAEVIDEVGADAAVGVRIRLGIHDGRGEIREGSTFAVYTPAGAGYLTSQRTLVSELMVVKPGAQEGVLDVHSENFRTAAQEVFRKYISMALIASQDPRP